MTRLKVFYLHPPNLYRRWLDPQTVEATLKFPAVTFPQLAACVPNPAVFLDGTYLEADPTLAMKSRWADVVCVNVVAKCGALNAQANIRLIRRINPRARIAMGGHHATFNHEEWCRRGADAVVRHEGEQTFPELLDAWEEGRSLEGIQGLTYRENGRVTVNPKRPFMADLDELPMPRFDLWDLTQYRFFTSKRGYTGSIESSRGCPHHCTFCSASNQWNNTQRHKSADRTLEELRTLRGMGIANLCFADDNLCEKRDRDRRIMEGILSEGMGFDWFAFFRADNVLADPETFDLAARSGLKFVLLGYESFSDDMQKRMNKEYENPLSLDDYRRVFRFFECRGVLVGGFFIIGHPGETRAERLRMFSHVNDVCHHPMIQIFRPMAGTVGYRKIKDQGLLLKEMFFHDARTSAIRTDPTLFRDLFLFQARYFLSPRRLLQAFRMGKEQCFYYWRVYTRIFRNLFSPTWSSVTDYIRLKRLGHRPETVRTYHDWLEKKYLDSSFIRRVEARLVKGMGVSIEAANFFGHGHGRGHEKKIHNSD